MRQPNPPTPEKTGLLLALLWLVSHCSAWWTVLPPARAALPASHLEKKCYDSSKVSFSWCVSHWLTSACSHLPSMQNSAPWDPSAPLGKKKTINIWHIWKPGARWSPVCVYNCVWEMTVENENHVTRTDWRAHAAHKCEKQTFLFDQSSKFMSLHVGDGSRCLRITVKMLSYLLLLLH